MKPAPTTTTRRGEAWSSPRRRRQSSRVRRTNTPPNSGWPASTARRRPRGDDEPVVADPRAVIERDPPGRDIQRRGPHSEAQLQAEVRVLVLGPQPDALGLERPGQQLLGQRRSVVGEVVLGADQREATVVALGPQGLGGPQSGQRGTHHDDLSQHRLTLGGPHPNRGRRRRRRRRGGASGRDSQRSPNATSTTAAIRANMATAATTAAPSTTQAITAPLSRPDALAPEPHVHRARGYR